MRNKLQLLLLPFGGFSLLVISTLLPESLRFLSSVMLVLSILMTIVFYFITLLQVIRIQSWETYAKLFWLVAIICLPVIGNVIYVIFFETANRRQELHGSW